MLIFRVRAPPLQGLLTPLTENWVTVSPKKRTRAMIGTQSKKPSSLKPQGPPTVTITTSTPLTVPIKPKANASKKTNNPAEHIRVTLADPSVMNTKCENSSNSDTFLHMENDEEEGMDAKENADMYLNLENIEDVEMSSDSTKRKRVEEGEECNSCP